MMAIKWDYVKVIAWMASIQIPLCEITSSLSLSFIVIIVILMRLFILWQCLSFYLVYFLFTLLEIYFLCEQWHCMELPGHCMFAILYFTSSHIFFPSKEMILCWFCNIKRAGGMRNTDVRILFSFDFGEIVVMLKLF